MHILKVKYTELNFLTLQQFRLPNGLPAVKSIHINYTK